MDTARRIITALDFDDVRDAEKLVELLGETCASYKIGLELLTTAGPDLARRLAAEGNDVFMDLKLFEIPNSVAGAVRAAGRLGATMVTVHALGGHDIMTAAVQAAADFPRLNVIALTVVTSLTDRDLTAVGISSDVDDQVKRLANLAREAGCHGVVASPREAPTLRAELGPDALIITPGVTLHREDVDKVTEHARATDAATALATGASHVVLGRSLTRSPDPSAALARLQNELA